MILACFVFFRDDTLESHCYFFICLIAVDHKQEKNPSQSSKKKFFLIFFENVDLAILPTLHPSPRKTKGLGSKRKVILNTSNSQLSEKKIKTHLNSQYFILNGLKNRKKFKIFVKLI